MLIVHRSNRPDALLDALVDVLRRPLAGGPFVEELIAVSSRGLETWLEMELARRLSLAANLRFPFPRALVHELMAAGLGMGPEGLAAFESLSRPRLAWRILAALDTLIDAPDFAALASYVHDDARGTKRFQLAERIAEVFDQYAVYRPELLEAWERAEPSEAPGQAWQALLWRAIVAGHAAEAEAHTGRVARRFLADAAGGKLQAEAFPERVSLFGVSALPPLFLQVLKALPRETEVHLFLPSPSEAYWGDISSRRELLRRSIRQDRALDELVRELHFDEGHPLLASMGRPGRDLQFLLEQAPAYVDAQRERYVDPAPALELWLSSGAPTLASAPPVTMLQALQSDILQLRARGDEALLPIAPDDASIAVHSCHSRAREVEVLHDQLRRMFEDDPSLLPSDVVVMAPEIEDYAPIVDAVFAGEVAPPLRIPYAISDRSPRTDVAVADAVLAALGLVRSRLEVVDVLDLLALPPVARRFGVGEADLEALRPWLIQAGARWGVDASHRQGFGQPEDEANTWRFALDRLLLGLASPSGDGELFAGRHGLDLVEGQGAELLGRFAAFAEVLFALMQELRRPRPMAAWPQALDDALSGLISLDRDALWQLQRVREVLAQIATEAADAGHRAEVDVAVLRSMLERHFTATRSPAGFLRLGLTFCSMLPMRSIPFRVICLLGLNDGEFPRPDRRPGFDLIAASPQAGDHSRRDDDRYLFLEAIMAARERLWMSFVGQSIRSNDPLPPSVVVSDLVDALAAGHVLSATEEAPGLEERQADLSRRLVLRHPLQPFSPRYFLDSAIEGEPDSRLFSYSRAAYEAATAARAFSVSTREPVAFLSQALELPEDEPRVLGLDDLIRFFQRPVDVFLRRRLGLRPAIEEESVPSREPMLLDGLEAWSLGNELLAGALEGIDPESGLAMARARGVVPLGTPGEREFARVAARVDVLAEAVRVARGGAALAPIELDLEIDGTRLSGVLDSLWPRGQVRADAGMQNERRALDCWIRHLCYAAAAPPDVPGESRLITRSGGAGGPSYTELAFGAMSASEAQAELSQLVSLFWAGLQRPLAFFIHSAFAFVEEEQKLHKKGGLAETEVHARALAKANAAWRGGWRAGESESPAIARVFPEAAQAGDLALLDGSTLPPEQRFTALARAVLSPLLDQRLAAPGRRS